LAKTGTKTRTKPSPQAAWDPFFTDLGGGIDIAYFDSGCHVGLALFASFIDFLFFHRYLFDQLGVNLRLIF
jgi:hypothetical protein